MNGIHACLNAGCFFVPDVKNGVHGEDPAGAEEEGPDNFFGGHAQDKRSGKIGVRPLEKEPGEPNKKHCKEECVEKGKTDSGEKGDGQASRRL